jgi:hypothetical protein
MMMTGMFALVLVHQGFEFARAPQQTAPGHCHIIQLVGVGTKSGSIDFLIPQ